MPIQYFTSHMPAIRRAGSTPHLVAGNPVKFFYVGSKDRDVGAVTAASVLDRSWSWEPELGTEPRTPLSDTGILTRTLNIYFLNGG